MTIQGYLDKMKDIQIGILDYISDKQEENDFQQLSQLLDSHKIRDDKHELKSLFHLIIKIANNHNRSADFFSRIFQILTIFKNDIQKYFSNSTIFDLFKSNKRLLLFLFEEKIITMDKSISSIITNKLYDKNYAHYFYPEIKPFIDETFSEEISADLPDDFEERRKIGENENYICQLIRDDKVEDFITLVNKKNISLNSQIKSSIFETNTLLIKKEPTFIEYAAFFGSIQIFNYLRMNNVDLSPSLWIYTIHSKNPSLIHLLEENDVNPTDDYIEILNESIKCHHIQISEYIQNNLIQNENLTNFMSSCLKSYNFNFIKIDDINESTLYDLCKYEHLILVEFLSKQPKFDPTFVKVFE